ncbi:MAG: hypothetical protein AAGA37_19880 [Actinomycetota bacterium]
MAVTSQHTSIRDIPQLFDCDVETAYGFVNPWVDSVLDRLYDGFDRADHVRIDTRVSMLAAGWWPCIPGWHLDFAPRDGRKILFDQIDPDAYRAWTTYLGPCPTQFVDHDACGVGTYEDHSKAIEADESLDYCQGAPDELMSFGPLSWHRGTAAKVGPGMHWRAFIRIVEFAKPQTFANEERNQTQVYIPSEHGGW